MNFDHNIFGKLRLSQYFPFSKIENVSSFEFMDKLWVGETIGFTHCLQRKGSSQLTKALAVDLSDVNERWICEKIIAEFGLRLKYGMKLQEINAIMGVPYKSNSFIRNRTEHMYISSAAPKYYISCTVDEVDGLTYIDVITDDEVIKELIE